MNKPQNTKTKGDDDDDIKVKINCVESWSRRFQGRHELGKKPAATAAATTAPTNKKIKNSSQIFKRFVFFL